MIERHAPYIDDLLRAEPWRVGPGVGGAPCRGALAWDGGERWLCACGRIGHHAFLLHLPVAHPAARLLSAFARFARAVAAALA